MSLSYYAALSVLTSFAIFSPRKSERVALFVVLFSCCCQFSVSLARGPYVDLQCVIVAFHILSHNFKIIE